MRRNARSIDLLRRLRDATLPCRALPLVAGLLAGAPLALALLAAPAKADNRVGAWSTLAHWPLIPLHAIVLPDGRVLSYGSDGDGTQTGRFLYDVWSPTLGLGANAHWTLPNVTLTDLFCNAQIVLPQSGNVALFGGDIWNGSTTTNVGNNNSDVFNPATNILSRGANMHSPRWYATVTTLPSGETYVQGGRGGPGLVGGELRPEIRDLAGNFRVLNGADTSGLYWYYPRNWVAADGRIFGYSDRTMYYINPTGAGSATYAGTMPANGPSGVTSSEVMFAPGRILRVGGGALLGDGGDPGPECRRGDRHHQRCPGGDPRRQPADGAALGQCHGGAGRPGGGHRRQPGNNQLAGANHNALIWDPANPGVDGGRADRHHRRIIPASTTRSACCCPTPRSWSAAAVPAGRPSRGRRSTPTPSSTIRLTCSRRPTSGRRGRGSCRRRRCSPWAPASRSASPTRWASPG